MAVSHPCVAQLSADMKSFAEPVKEVQILDENGKPFYEKNNDKRFFEAVWMHKYNGKGRKVGSRGWRGGR